MLPAVIMIVLSAFSSGAGVQARSHVTGEASVTILRALAAQQVRSIDLGRVLPANTEGELVLSPDGSLDCSGMRMCTGAPSPATIRVSGSDGMVNVSVSPEIRLVGPGTEEMAFRPVLSASQILLSGGEGQLFVGGSLRIGRDQAAGSYSGVYNIQFEYQ